MCVRRQDDLIELAVHHPFPDQARQTMTDVTAGLVEAFATDQAFVIVDVDRFVRNDNRRLDPGTLG